MGCVGLWHDPRRDSVCPARQRCSDCKVALTYAPSSYFLSTGYLVIKVQPRREEPELASKPTLHLRTGPFCARSLHDQGPACTPAALTPSHTPRCSRPHPRAVRRSGTIRAKACLNAGKPIGRLIAPQGCGRRHWQARRRVERKGASSRASSPKPHVAPAPLRLPGCTWSRKQPGGGGGDPGHRPAPTASAAGGTLPVLAPRLAASAWSGPRAWRGHRRHRRQGGVPMGSRTWALS